MKPTEKMIPQMKIVSTGCGTNPSNLRYGSFKTLKDGVTEKILEEVMAKISPNLRKTINPQIQGTQWSPSKRIRNQIIKLLKTSNKEKNLKHIQRLKDMLIQRNKNKNECRVFTRNNASKKTIAQQYLKYQNKQTNKQTPTPKQTQLST